MKFRILASYIRATNVHDERDILSIRSGWLFYIFLVFILFSSAHTDKLRVHVVHTASVPFLELDYYKQKKKSNAASLLQLLR